LHHTPGAAFDLGGPRGLYIVVGLVMEARQQIRGQLGALIDGEP
jgi:hypothetical protein